MIKNGNEIKFEVKEPLKIENEKIVVKLDGYIITIEKENKND